MKPDCAVLESKARLGLSLEPEEALQLLAWTSRLTCALENIEGWLGWAAEHNDWSAVQASAGTQQFNVAQTLAG